MHRSKIKKVDPRILSLSLCQHFPRAAACRERIFPQNKHRSCHVAMIMPYHPTSGSTPPSPLSLSTSLNKTKYQDSRHVRSSCCFQGSTGGRPGLCQEG